MKVIISKPASPGSAFFGQYHNNMSNLKISFNSLKTTSHPTGTELAGHCGITKLNRSPLSEKLNDRLSGPSSQAKNPYNIYCKFLPHKNQISTCIHEIFFDHEHSRPCGSFS